MSATTKTLRCLIVEDVEDDAQLMLRQLRAAGYDVTWERVDTPEAMRAALAHQPWDVVLSDYQMPRFSGLAALEILRESGIDLPFIIVSGTIGEEVAVAAMKAGVDDYLIKGELAHLTVAVERELRNAATRRERKVAEAALRENQALLAQAEALGKVGGWEFDVETKQQTWTDAVYAIHELDRSVHPTVELGVNFYTPESQPIIARAVQRAIALGEPFDVDLEIITAKGHRRSVHAVGQADPARRRISGFIQDISERKMAEAALRRQADELLARNSELTRFNRAAVGRELRMVELKEQVNELCCRLGEAPRHAISRSPRGPGPVAGLEPAPAPPGGGGA